MTKAEHKIISSFFKNKVHECEGLSYEDLFVKIMVEHNPNFQSVTAYGNIGDRKNDGYDKKTGTYYQVYAPKILSERIRVAKNKLNEDFRKLYNYWNTIYEVKSYFFVVNDKYKHGVEPELNKAISELENEFSNISFGLLFNKNLEDLFFELSDFKRNEIIYIPDYENLELDALGLNIVIEHLIKLKTINIVENIPDNPDRDKKISFNKLGEQASNYIKFGSYQKSELDQYFKKNTDLKENLRIKFSTLYQEGKILFTDNSDDIYTYILRKASPKDEQYIVNAVIVLMSMYFETCDIFEEPLEPKQKTLFEQ